MSVKNQHLFTKLMACSVAALIGISAMPGDAVAGFKWQGPAKSEATVFPNEKDYIEPEIRWHGEGNDAPVANLMDDATMVDEALPAPVTAETLGSLAGMESYPEDSTQDNGDLISQIVSDEPQTSSVAPSSTAAPVLSVENAELAQGFGSDIPLVMAIRQIIPSSQPFAFEPGIDLGAPVSWQGGAPWPEVLSNTLSSAGLYARMHRDMVIIGKFTSGTSAPAPMFGGEDHAAFDAPVTTMTAPAPVQSSKPQTEIEKSMAAQSGGMMTAPAADTTMNSVNSAPVIAAAQWTVQPGQTLRDAVTTWATEAGVKLYWTTDYDYRIESAHAFSGSFEEALAQLLDTFADMTPQPYGQLHKSSEGGQVLIIKTYDNNMG